MFEELLWMVGFALFSFIISYLLLHFTPEPLNKAVKGLAIIGIIIHELCHLLMCGITNTRVHNYSLVERVNDPEGKRKLQYGGSVTVKEDRFTFLQALFVALAPIYLSFWFFFFLLNQLLYTNLNVLLFFLFIFIMFSLILGASPSIADIINIPKAFNRKPLYSLYQIVLLVLSGVTIWLIITVYNISIFHEIVYYFFIFIGYYFYKYGIKAIALIYYSLRGVKRSL